MKRKSFALLSVLALTVAVFGALAVMDQPVEAAPIPPVDCSIVLCPAPDCPAGTKAVVLPGDCCFTCVPTK